MSFSCAAATMSPQFASPQFRRQRTCLYVSLGVASAFFVANGAMVSGRDGQIGRMPLKFMAWMITINLIGAVIYAARVSSGL